MTIPRRSTCSVKIWIIAHPIQGKIERVPVDKRIDKQLQGCGDLYWTKAKSQSLGGTGSFSHNKCTNSFKQPKGFIKKKSLISKLSFD